MNVPDGLQYTDRQEWLRLEGAAGRVGLTDPLQGRLGPIVAIELPSEGLALKCGDLAAVVRSESRTHEFLTPISGTVTAVNTRLATEPGLINTDPYAGGWLVTLRIEAGEEIEHLRDADTFRKMLAAIREPDSP